MLSAKNKDNLINMEGQNQHSLRDHEGVFQGVLNLCQVETREVGGATAGEWQKGNDYL